MDETFCASTSSRTTQSHRQTLITSCCTLHPGLDWLVRLQKGAAIVGKGEQGEDRFECDGQTEGGKEELDVDLAH